MARHVVRLSLNPLLCGAATLTVHSRQLGLKSQEALTEVNDDLKSQRHHPGSAARSRTAAAK
jgi:hypothetical protein